MSNLEKDEITPSQEYIKSFNQGYYMAKYHPDFPKESVSGNNQSTRSKAFSLGMMQYEVEKKLEKSLSFLSKNNKLKNIEVKKDRDDKDMDR